MKLKELLKSKQLSELKKGTGATEKTPADWPRGDLGEGGGVLIKQKESVANME